MLGYGQGKRALSHTDCCCEWKLLIMERGADDRRTIGLAKGVNYSWEYAAGFTPHSLAAGRGIKNEI